MREAGDPATGQPFGSTVDNLKSAIAGESTCRIGPFKSFSHYFRFIWCIYVSFGFRETDRVKNNRTCLC